VDQISRVHIHVKVGHSVRRLSGPAVMWSGVFIVYILVCYRISHGDCTAGGSSHSKSKNKKIKFCCSSVYSEDSLEQKLAPEMPDVLPALWSSQEHKHLLLMATSTHLYMYQGMANI
jgi:hypothetical protein